MRRNKIVSLGSLRIWLLALGILASNASAQVIETVAGGGVRDGVIATAAPAGHPMGVAVDSLGNLYFADFFNHRIRKVTAATGIISTVVGTGVPIYNGDNIAANGAALYLPRGVAVDGAGNLYIADTGNGRIRKVTAATGLITTVAGTGAAGYNGDDVDATSISLNYVAGVAVDSIGNLYIAESGTHRIRKVTAATGIITTVAGTGALGYNGDNIAATGARLYDPRGVALDSSGNLYIADASNNRIRKVTAANGVISTVAGTAGFGYNGDNIAATGATLWHPNGITVDSIGNLYIADTDNNRIRKVTVATGIIDTLGGANLASYGVAVDSSDDLYVTDVNNNRIRKLTVATGAVATVAGVISSYDDNNIAATDSTLNDPMEVAVDLAGNVYIADWLNARIRKVAAGTGIITTVAGTGSGAYNGDNIAATSATVDAFGVAIDSSGNIYIADQGNHRIRKVAAATGIITTVAGTGASGYNGDSIAATSANINPAGVAVDSSGNIYIADQGNHRIRKVAAGTGIITTVAGTGASGYNGDNIAATGATLSFPNVITVDSSGNLYIGDSNHRVRKVTVATGIITTVAGTGTVNYNGDGIAATSANLQANGIAVDPSGNLYIGDTYNNRVRRVAAATGVIDTVAGGVASFAVFSYNGDHIAAISAMLDHPRGVALDATGSLYIADTYNDRVRKVTNAPPTISIVSPSAGAVVTGVVVISGTAAAFAPVSSVAVSINGGPYVLATGTTSWTFNFNTTALPNGVHTITARALDSYGNAVTASTSITVTALPGVFSRKTHGLVGAFELPIDAAPATSGNISIEPRAIGSGHLIVFRYGEVVSAYGTVAVVDSGNAPVGATATAVDNEVRVSLPSVADGSRVTITLAGITTGSGMFNASTSMGFLEGDVNKSGKVDTLDVSAGKARAGQIVNAGNFLYDLNGSGVITAAEVSAMKARLNRTLLP